MNSGGKKCLGAEGDTVILTGCDSGSTWEAQGNGAFFAFAMLCYICLFQVFIHGCAGQLKLGRAGNYCLSQNGVAAGVEDAAARGAITSSSSADVAAHGANMAVDGSSKTFWVALFSFKFLRQLISCCCFAGECTGPRRPSHSYRRSWWRQAFT